MSEIRMPQVGKKASDATLVRWLKSEGDSVAKGDLLFLAESEEGLAEVESAVSGVLQKILCAERQTVAVNVPVAVIQAASSAPSSAATLPAQKKESSMSQSPSSSSGAPGDVIPILMPQAGNSMEEGTVLSWNVKVGDRVNAGDILAEIETDKATMELESPGSGRIARFVANVGDIVPVKQAIAYIAENDADVDAYIGGEAKEAAPAKKQAAAPTSIQAPEPSAAPTATPSKSDRTKASPAARKIAGERGIDIATLPPGSGPAGRILSTDLPASAPAGFASAAAGQAARRPMSKMRRAIAKGLTWSKQNVPHFYLRITIDAEPLIAFHLAEKEKQRVSINDVLVLACARTMQEFPSIRTQVDGNDLVEIPNANIGIAVGTDDGLVVPVVLGVERMTLAQLAVETRRVVEEARKGKVAGQGKGVFTISNLGMFGVEEFAAIINPPEAAILAVGGVREDVIVRDGAMRPGRVMTMTLSLDHRVVDGLEGAKFAARLKEILENPAEHLR